MNTLNKISLNLRALDTLNKIHDLVSSNKTIFIHI